MRFTLVYAPSAQQELADLWCAAPDRAALTAAANTLDQRLRRAPQQVGTPRSEGYWLIVHLPLAML
jgi:hypothetical protein